MSSPSGEAASNGRTEFDPASFPIFHGLSQDECQEILALATTENYQAGDRILREGNSNQILWFIISGECQVCKDSSGEAEMELAVLGPGAVFGDMSFFSPAPHSASVVARSHVEVRRLDRAAFNQLEQSHPAITGRISLNTIKMLSDRLRRMDDRAHDLLERLGADKQREEWREFRSRLYADWEF